MDTPGQSASTNKRPTMSDVALLAGVSRQTVSNLVNQRSHLMRIDTQRRVERAMAELNYQPHMLARGLRSGRILTLGFLVLDEHPKFLADPLTDLLLAGLGDTARDHGYSLLIQASRPSGPNPGFFNPLIERRVDAAAVVLSGEPELRQWHVEQLVANQAPFVVFDERAAGQFGFSVSATNAEASEALAAHLIDRGHTRIGFVAARVPWPVIEQRHKGYRRALESMGIAPDPEIELFEGGLEAESGREMADKLLSQTNPPTAIMATSDLLAAGVMQAAKRRGLTIPRDIAITGFDDFSFSELLEPPLTTARVPAYEMGQAAAELLVESLEGKLPNERDVMLEVELRVRASS